MAEEVEMTPVAAEPPKANPLAKPTVSLKPGLKLPPKPGLKLPTQTALKPGLKLPPKPSAAGAALKPGLKLPTQTALKPGIKLPPKPVIRKPGATIAAMPLPKPVTPVAEKPAAPAASEPPAAKPVAVDAQGVGKLPTVSATTAERGAAPDVSALPKPMEALKSVTQKLKGITQEIPQQAILHKTGIIADGASETQKEAAKHKTARISLSDAMGVAPVKNENAPMKTIRIKRPVGLAGTAPAAPAPAVPAEAPAALSEAAPAAAPAAESPAPAPNITQRKTLKITRPGGAVRPSGKFGIKRPSQATTIASVPAAEAPAASAPAEGAVADIADIPDVPAMPAPVQSAPVSEGPAWLWTLSTVVQIAACLAIGALAWFLYTNTQTQYF